MATYTYTWKIPSMSNTEKELLCHGWIKQHYNKYITSHVIMLLSKFYTNDEFLLKDIKNSEYLNYYTSPLIDISSFKWYIEIYPNGCNQFTKEKVILFVCLASSPPNLSKINATYKLLISETETEYSDTHSFDEESYYNGWDINLLSLNKIQNIDIKSLTIKLQLKVNFVYNKTDKNNLILLATYFNNISYKPKAIATSIIEVKTDQEYPCANYIWNINDKSLLNQIKTAKNGDPFDGKPFEILGFKFYLELYPNGDVFNREGNVDLYLNLLSFNPSLSVIFIKYHLSIIETNTSWNGYHHFKQSSQSWGWRQQLKFKDIQNDLINKLTIRVKIIILDVYDKNGNLIQDYIKKRVNNQLKIMNINSIKLLPPIMYKWKIRDKNTINLIQNASDVVGFASPVFNAFRTKLSLYFNMVLIFVIGNQSNQPNQSIIIAYPCTAGDGSSLQDDMLIMVINVKQECDNNVVANKINNNVVLLHNQMMMIHVICVFMFFVLLL